MQTLPPNQRKEPTARPPSNRMRASRHCPTLLRPCGTRLRSRFRLARANYVVSPSSPRPGPDVPVRRQIYGWAGTTKRSHAEVLAHAGLRGAHRRRDRAGRGGGGSIRVHCPARLRADDLDDGAARRTRRHEGIAATCRSAVVRPDVRSGRRVAAGRRPSACRASAPRSGADACAAGLSSRCTRAPVPYR